ncbi:nucleic-acid-binding protein from transposon X-element, partial [Trichonephila inaurata madagascariensis]
IELLSFDVNVATAHLDKCNTCVECEDLCDTLKEIFLTLNDPNIDNTPERLRLINVIQWTALKCSRKSIRLQNKEFKDYIEEIKRLNRVPTVSAPASQPKRKKVKRQPASPRKDTPSKKQACSERSLPNNTSLPISETRESSKGRRNAAGEAGEEGKKEKRKPLGKFCDTPLEGRYENGKLRVFPVSAEEHRLIQKYISDNKLRSHTFEMAHNKQLKVVIRGLPTDFNQEELMSELHAFGFTPNHISLLRNRKTNTNMPLFLVTLPKCPANQDIFNMKTIGFFRVVVEPLNKSSMPPQCYRCQEFFLDFALVRRSV